MGETFDQLLNEVRRCAVCAARLPLGPRPIVQARPEARVLIIGQAPGSKVHASGVPWRDASGGRLRQWMGIDEAAFYDARRVAIVPMGFCYPGAGASGDLPPRPECAPLWHGRLLSRLPELRLTLLVGAHAQAYYLPRGGKTNLTETVRGFRGSMPRFFPLPHPSWRSTIWMRKNPVVRRRGAAGAAKSDRRGDALTARVSRGRRGMFQQGLFEGKKVLVTGGGTGLGRAMAERLLGLGAEIAICGRRRSVCDAAAEEMTKAHGGVVKSYGVDIRDAAAVEAMVEAIFQDGPLTSLINNAAGNFIARTEDLSPRGFDAIAGIVMHGTFYVTQSVGKRWIVGGMRGSVVSITVTWTRNGGPFVVPSAMSKAAVQAMTMSLASEWGRYGIRLNAIAPGEIPTEGMSKRLNPGQEPGLRRRPSTRWAASAASRNCKTSRPSSCPTAAIG